MISATKTNKKKCTRQWISRKGTCFLSAFISAQITLCNEQNTEKKRSAKENTFKHSIPYPHVKYIFESKFLKIKIALIISTIRIIKFAFQNI